MITGELRNKIDGIWDIFWSSGMTNPLTVIEQITYLMFIKILDGNELKKEVKRRDILAFAKKKADVLGEYADKIIDSLAFFNPKWHNTTYRDKQWQCDYTSIG